jgi:hypothetical protein
MIETKKKEVKKKKTLSKSIANLFTMHSKFNQETTNFYSNNN